MLNNKNTYEMPKVQITFLTNEDVLTASLTMISSGDVDPVNFTDLFKDSLGG